MLAQQRPDEQVYVGPTLVSNVGPTESTTEKTTLAQRCHAIWVIPPKNRRGRNQHSMSFQIPSASKDAFKKSVFPQTIRDWNVIPDSLISCAEVSDDWNS